MSSAGVIYRISTKLTSATPHVFYKSSLLHLRLNIHNKGSIWNLVCERNVRPWYCYRVYLLPDGIHFCQIVWVLPDCIFCPTKPSFSNSSALSPSPYLRKLIHPTIHKNTTPFSSNNPANPHRIKLFELAMPLFPHAPTSESNPPPALSPAHTHPRKDTSNPAPALLNRSSHTQSALVPSPPLS